MKQIAYLFFFLVFGFTHAHAQQMTISPENPMPGETVKLTYQPAEALSSIDVTAYLFTAFDPKAVEVPMKSDGEAFIGKISLPKEATGVMLSFKNESGENIDNNDKKGHKFLLYQADRKTAVPGAYAAKSNMYAQYGYYGGIERDREKALNLLKKEFKLHPESRQNADFFLAYMSYAKRLKNEAALAEGKARLEELKSSKKPTEAELGQAIRLAQTLEMEEEESLLYQKYQKKFPQGEVVQSMLRKEFYNAESLDDKLAVYDRFEKKFKGMEAADDNRNTLLGSIAGAYGQAEDWPNFEKYLGMISDPSRQARTLNGLAWPLSGESLDGEAKHVERAKKYSATSLELMKNAKASPEDRPDYLTEKQYLKSLDRTYAMYADTYALLAYHAGDLKEAFKYQTIACEADNFQDASLLERYCHFMESGKSPAETEQFLAKQIANGNATSRMKEQHKRLFLANNTVETAYQKYSAELQKKADEKMRAELEEKMMKEDAPEFQLVNLDGKQVTLEGLKGKIVVLDFWATWCGPCKASFPGMQRAVDLYSDRDDVEFVFINTWERAKDKKQNAADFIASKGYRFQVLMDEENKMVSDYKVTGIPTKFILDKEGKIRFRSSGFGGNDDELVRELSLMIDMTEAAGKAGVTGAP